MRAHRPTRKARRARSRRAFVRFNPAEAPSRYVLPWWTEDVVGYRVYLLDAPVLQWWSEGWENNRSYRDEFLRHALLGVMLIDPAGCHDPRTREDIGVVHTSAALAGWGPLLYDFAALVATNIYGVALTSDRQSVSRAARVVWDTYRDWRPDVERVRINDACPAEDNGIPEFGILMEPRVFRRAWGVNPEEWLSNQAFETWARTNGMSRNELADIHVMADMFFHLVSPTDPEGRLHARASLTREREDLKRHYETWRWPAE